MSEILRQATDYTLVFLILQNKRIDKQPNIRENEKCESSFTQTNISTTC